MVFGIKSEKGSLAIGEFVTQVAVWVIGQQGGAAIRRDDEAQRRGPGQYFSPWQNIISIKHCVTRAAIDDCFTFGLDGCCPNLHIIDEKITINTIHNRIIGKGYINLIIPCERYGGSKIAPGACGHCPGLLTYPVNP